MKKFIIFSIFLLLSFNMLIVTSLAQPATFKEGFYTADELHLDPNVNHTVENISPNEYICFIVIDSAQVTRQFLRLNPQSEKFILPPIEKGYEIIVVGNGEVIIS